MGDVEKGKALFTKMCLQCHTIQPGGKTKRGPNLHKIYGKKCECATAKSEEARNFSWTDANLDKFLENPKKFMPGTTMLFAGLKKPEDRKNVIAYLKTI